MRYRKIKIIPPPPNYRPFIRPIWFIWIILHNLQNKSNRIKHVLINRIHHRIHIFYMFVNIHSILFHHSLYNI
jgi:hypothetical protein